MTLGNGECCQCGSVAELPMLPVSNYVALKPNANDQQFYGDYNK